MLIEHQQKEKLHQFNLFILNLMKQIEKFKSDLQVEIGIDHNEYSHTQS